MNFDFNSREHRWLQDLVERMQSLAADLDLEAHDLAAVTSAVRGCLRRLQPTGYLRQGLLAAETTAEARVLLMAAREALAAIAPSVCLAVENSARLFGRILGAWGDPDQQARWLDPLCEGRLLGAVALSETAMNVDNEPLATEARPDGAGVVIEGRKRYVLNAPLADAVAVVGRLAGDPVVLLVDARTPGLRIGERLPTFGYPGTAVADLTLDGCRIALADVIRPANPADLLSTLRRWENEVLVGTGLGLMKAAFEEAKAYAHTHRTGGKPIVAYQEVAFKLAEMLTLYQTSQLLAYRAAWAAGGDLRAAEELTWCAKVFCGEAAESVASHALQILAGAGYFAPSRAASALCCAKYGQIAGTSTELARMKIGDAAL